jgi:hypothetical protein
MSEENNTAQGTNVSHGTNQSENSGGQLNSNGGSQSSAQQGEGYNAYNFWTANATKNEGQTGAEQNNQQNTANNGENNQNTQNKQVPIENKLAMYQRLLDKNNKQMAELQAKFDAMQNGNTNQRKGLNQSFEENNTLDRSIYDELGKKIDEKFSSIEEQNFYDKVQTNAEKYINKIPNLPSEVQDKFINAINSDVVIKGIKNNLIGFEDIYKILTYDKLVEKLNSLTVAQRNKQNLNNSAGSGDSGGEMQDASNAKDFFALNPDKANDPDYVMEYKKKKGLL